MLAGRTLLVADESTYYQTVLSLTFADEGMTVAMAGDSQEALAKLERSSPDVIILSVSLPGVGGYELCRIVKHDERFRHIPVMLLAGLQESFDEAEARRAGVDDVVAKPFKSIRELVGRVGSLLGSKSMEKGAREFSTLGLDSAEPEAAPVADNRTPVSDNAESHVTVFVEAPLMNEPESMNTEGELQGNTCVADLALQTADTQKLERIDGGHESEPPIENVQDNTMEYPRIIASETVTEPLIDVSTSPHNSESPEISTEPLIENRPSWSAIVVDEQVDAPAQVQTSMMSTMNETSSQQATPSTRANTFNDSLLDLDDFSAPQSALEYDLVLDLDYEAPDADSGLTLSESLSEPVATAAAPEHVYDVGFEDEEPAVAAEELHEWTVVAEPAAEFPSPVTVPAKDLPSTDQAMGLSAEAIDAIARRVVEQLSEKVIREIAWEVVPELARLLIKQKLADKV